MPLVWATWILNAAAVYTALGVLFAAVFFLGLFRRIEPAVGAGTWGFRVLILPGVIALWPVLLSVVIRGPIEPRTPHDRASA